ncbi:MAG: DUF3788 family protein [Acidobacteria bacterium]|nr:DUF3788 family protein [Acidobacteriota bacterium]
MSVPTSLSKNPFRDPEIKPTWAQLSRLAGDRAAIRFEELRSRVGAVAGLREELRYCGADGGWVVRYSVGDAVLFTVHILPGNLEAGIEMDQSLREKVLKSRITGGVKDAVRRVSGEKTAAGVKLSLATRAAVRAFVRLVLIKSKTAAHESS